MAQFKISLPVDYRDELNTDLKRVRDRIAGRSAEKTLPAYPVFNERLMKTMATPSEELHHACTGMAGEAGEALEISKKVWVYNKPLDVKHLIKELGDLRFYYQAALNMLGLTDEHIVAQNMLKLDVRYSEGVYSDAAANARVDTALSAAGSKGDAVPAPRKFMGQATPDAVDGNGSPVARNMNDVFDAEMNASLRQLRRDEQP